MFYWLINSLRYIDIVEIDSSITDRIGCPLILRHGLIKIEIDKYWNKMKSAIVLRMIF